MAAAPCSTNWVGAAPKPSAADSTSPPAWAKPPHRTSPSPIAVLARRRIAHRMGAPAPPRRRRCSRHQDHLRDRPRTAVDAAGLPQPRRPARCGRSCPTAASCDCCATPQRWHVSPTSSSTSTKSSPTSSTPTSGCSSSPCTPPDSRPVSPRPPRSRPPTRRGATPKTSRTPRARLDNCWLERWRIQAIDVGSRARLQPPARHRPCAGAPRQRIPVCPDNISCAKHSPTQHDADRDLHRALLRIAYRLIVLFVAEDRGLLHTADVNAAAPERYSTLLFHRTTAATGCHPRRRPAHRPVGSPPDRHRRPGRRWTRALGLSGLGASLFSRDFLGILDGARLPNHAFLAAIKALSQIDDPVTGTPRHVDYRNLDSEELGGMYEGLLAYTPRYHPADHSFTLDVAAGNERKKSGSVLHTVRPYRARPGRGTRPAYRRGASDQIPKQALLALTVVDPACGSGHFVVAAARRIGVGAWPTVRTGDTEPSPPTVRAATADVIEHCVYGVDLNDLAIEITKSHSGWKPSTPAAHSHSSTPTSASATRCWAPPRHCSKQYPRYRVRGPR